MLELDYKESRRTDQHGNQFKYRAKVKDVRGAQMGRWAWDVFLWRGSSLHPITQFSEGALKQMAGTTNPGLLICSSNDCGSMAINDEKAEVVSLFPVRYGKYGVQG